MSGSKFPNKCPDIFGRGKFGPVKSDDRKSREFYEYCSLEALSNPAVSHLIRAIENNDCPFDYHRNVSFRKCRRPRAAGYIAKDKHIFLCHNAYSNKDNVAASLAHELVHMYDHCRTNLDFDDIQQLACTETCVRRKALASISMKNGVTPQDAQKALDHVFEKCINDLTPFSNKQ